ncbi:hypothetical protein A2Z00_01800 [Candidatus Gottesmanbacteria bacterium RBG_13_45_10]|uniref:Uncharacterized protein n=1 Tax=Candidatus Gottesmanbacteria bacterium RBG_13_45_10 TaxID=1798370 RepID=A0A1F5ZHI4_9BACT|nr:MAG: hypothetical protein A2Z00_01800 [Candidatus Gottesmanbacteria bacterium RBG_13_45_10]
MDDRTKTLAAVTVIVGVCVFVAIVVGVLVSGKKIVSPVPEENAIQIIFVSPSPITATPTLTETPSPKTSKSTPNATDTPSE